MGGESQYPSKFTHEKSVRKQCILFRTELFLAFNTHISFLLFKWTNLLKIFQKMNACGIVYAAHFEIFLLTQSWTIYYSLYRGKHLVVKNLNII